MKIGTVLKAINRHAAIYVCLAVFFALCRFFHHLARLTLEICNTDAHARMGVGERQDDESDGPN